MTSRASESTAPAATAGTSPRDDPLAAALRGFGPIGILAMLAVYFGNALFVPLSGLLVLAWAWRSRTPWRAIGYARPRSWMGGLIVGLALGVALKLVMKALVMPLLGADPVNQAYHHLAGNTAALPAMLWLIVAGAGFGEETLFRGFMFERLGRLIGSGLVAKAAIVLITSLWFGLDHFAVQGLAGAQQATLVGLVFGSIYAVTGRLWMLICAHVAFDLTALAIIYWDVETEVARSLLG
ncbi:MAG TPA: CPBP family intramembrane glutamic endopeptidase [Allosphingosinicella sp.]|nr:CPBP family intramembrane glutamic endopeptidase [Allosphingosinicella sp.]